jgi:hypothetical protein
MTSDSNHRPPASLIVGVVALVLAVSGAAAALPGRGSVETNDIVRNAVKSKQIKDGQVRTADLAEGAVATSKLGDGSVTAPKLAAASVTESKLAPRLSGEVVTSGGSIKATGSETKLIVAAGPFTVWARCVEAAVADRGAELFFSSTEAQSASTVSGATGLDPGDAHFDGLDLFGGPAPNSDVITVVSPSTDAGWRTVTYALTAPSGASLTGSVALGTFLHGAECVFTGYGVA